MYSSILPILLFNQLLENEAQQICEQRSGFIQSEEKLSLVWLEMGALMSENSISLATCFVRIGACVWLELELELEFEAISIVSYVANKPFAKH